MTKTEVIGMIDRAKYIYVGVKGKELCYLPITHDAARERADMIAGAELRVEFGSHSVSDTLYIEAGE